MKASLLRATSPIVVCTHARSSAARLYHEGKPLKHDLKGHRRTRMPPSQIIYRLEGDKIIIKCFDHRKDVYE